MSGQEQPGQAAEERAALGEREAVAVDRPQHDDEREDDEHLHQHRQHVLRADEPAVEQREARDRHHDHEHRGDDHPRVVALIGRRAPRRPRFRRRGCRRLRPEPPPVLRRGAAAGAAAAACRRLAAGACARTIGALASANAAGERGRTAHRRALRRAQVSASIRFILVPLKARPRRFPRCGCARPVRDRRRRSCRRRSSRFWRPSRSLRSRGREARS